MKCKYCGQELVEGKRFCPSCGKENEIEETVEAVEEIVTVEMYVEEQQPVEIKEGAKMTPDKLALAIVAGVVVVAIIIALIVNGLGKKNEIILDPGEGIETNEATEIVEAVEDSTVIETLPASGNPAEVACKNNYTYSDEEVLASADTVVATMEGAELTNGELQVYYWMEVINMLSSGYASYYGVDFTQPLELQMYDETMSWQQFFLSGALSSWLSYQGMALDAAAAEHVMTEDFAAPLETLYEDLESSAAAAGMESGLEMIQYNMGVGTDVETYAKYIETYFMGYSYFNELYEQISATPEEVEAYFAENEELYTEYGITKDSGDQMNVRHILALVEGGTTDETGVTTYSDEEWAACEAKAQAILDEWLAGEATEETFAQLAMERSEDGGSSSNGGLYEGLTADTNFVENFKNWYLEEGRQVGDYGLVRTEYGYHVMYFSGSEPVWFATAEADLISERANAIMPDCLARHPITVDYSLIKLALSRMGEEA